MAARATAVLPVAVAASTTPLQPANSQALSALICQSRNGYRTIQRLTSRRFACLIGCAGTRSLLRTKPQRGHVETLVDAGRSHRGQARSFVPKVRLISNSHLSWELVSKPSLFALKTCRWSTPQLVRSRGCTHPLGSKRALSSMTRTSVCRIIQACEQQRFYVLRIA